jgi:hypothetical protein
MDLTLFYPIVDGKQFCGIAFQLSADLVHWSAPQSATWDAEVCTPYPLGLGYPVMYPTLIDHADTTPNFERPGRTPHLYYVRINDGWKDRDLIRVPLTFTRLD